MRKIVAATLMIGGFILALGTMGSADLELITTTQIVVRCIISLGAMIVGYAIGCTMETRRR